MKAKRNRRNFFIVTSLLVRLTNKAFGTEYAPDEAVEYAKNARNDEQVKKNGKLQIVVRELITDKKNKNNQIADCVSKMIKKKKAAEEKLAKSRRMSLAKVAEAAKEGTAEGLQDCWDTLEEKITGEEDSCEYKEWSMEKIGAKELGVGTDKDEKNVVKDTMMTLLDAKHNDQGKAINTARTFGLFAFALCNQ